MLQRFIHSKYLSKYPVHPTATAYEKGRSIFDNASRHAGGEFFLKLDFASFFPSIKTKDWKGFLSARKNNDFDKDDVEILTRLLFWGNGENSPKCLSIGAPTSPVLSNILMHHFDVDVASAAKEASICYTRYADDITISARSCDNVLTFENWLRVYAKKLKSPQLTFNEEKRGLYSKARRRMVTGLVVTPAGNISIGRDRKRLISSMIHRFSKQELSEDQIMTLNGFLGFAIANEPYFVSSMREKYGSNTIDLILHQNH